MQALVPYQEAVDIVKEAGGDDLKVCYQCGLCSGTCPWNLVRSFNVRRLMHQAQLGLVDFEDEDVWTCATCGACVTVCPRGVEIIDVMRALRRIVSEVGAAKMPDSLRITGKNISASGNPQGEEAERRADWAKGHAVKEFGKGTDLLYYSCCIPAYDSKVRRVALATAAILNSVGANFGILGARERCCGESIRKAGSEIVFQSLAASNIQAFAEAGVRNVLVSSPHCYHTFKNEYSGMGSDFQVVHTAQYLAELIREGRLRFTKEVNRKVAYHDPCYLGRHNGIYDEPREVLRSIPGIELIELPDSREESLCCGGGGGRIWIETKRGQRFSDIRLEQTRRVGADVLAVACPYCMLNFDDAVLTSGDSPVEIMDITELVREGISG